MTLFVPGLKFFKVFIISSSSLMRKRNCFEVVHRNIAADIRGAVVD